MRWSQAFIPTLRQDPADAEAVSHRLLVRAGYMRRLMAGVYSMLPLGVRVRAKIARVIREEMDGIGCQEFLLPAVHPAELWRETGRWDVMGEEMFRLQDRRGADLALGMTHEEVFTVLALELSSYRELPQCWYQIQTKFRDEPRPKGGVLRTREFTMKDSYTFDLDPAGLDRSFELHHQAYQRIFTRLGLEALAVEASSGAMGGTDSVEFMVRSDSGEDLVARCAACGYAANVERATSRLAPPEDGAGLQAPERFPTPGVRTIEDLVAFPGGAPADRQIKTLVYMLDGNLSLVLLRGDHGLVEQKLQDGSRAVEVRPAHPEEVREALGADPGSLGAVGVSSYPVLADEALRGRRDMVTGANVDDYHLRGVDVARDIGVSSWLDLREVRHGEPCPECGAALEVYPAIEVGHIFKLGSTYAEALGARVQDEDGVARTMTMGSYGIGLERNMAAVVESHHDDKGIVWPVMVAPYEVVITMLRADDSAIAEAAEGIYSELRRGGVDVLLDDRSERPGVKFADAELIGIPYRLTVGPRSLEAGSVELTPRRTGESETVATANAAARVIEMVALERL